MIEKYIHTFETEEFICKFREITWKEGLLIDAKSFRKKDNIIYQNSEFEKREDRNSTLWLSGILVIVDFDLFPVT